jgi:hypothetical protein
MDRDRSSAPAAITTSRVMLVGAVGSTMANRHASRSAAFAPMTPSKTSFCACSNRARSKRRCRPIRRKASAAIWCAMRSRAISKRPAAPPTRRSANTTRPTNRLVAAELELRWNRALERVAELGNRIEKHMSAPTPTPISPEDFATLAFDLKTIWREPEALAVYPFEC